MMAKDEAAVEEADTMQLFNAWFDGVHQYATQVAEELKDHPNPEEYFRQMDKVIAAKENTP